MDDDLIEALRDVYDDTRCGLILLGNMEILHRYTDRSNRKRFAHFALFRGRVAMERKILAPSEGDVAALCASLSVNDPVARKFVQKAADQPGGLQKVRNLLDVAFKFGDGVLSRETIEKAAAVAGFSIK